MHIFAKILEVVGYGFVMLVFVSLLEFFHIGEKHD